MSDSGVCFEGKALRTSRLEMREERRVKDDSEKMEGWIFLQLSQGKLWVQIFLGEVLEVTFEHIKLGLPIQHKNGNVEWAVEYMSPEFGRGFWGRCENLGVSNILENRETG